jgi:hypothetical protein
VFCTAFISLPMDFDSRLTLSTALVLSQMASSVDLIGVCPCTFSQAMLSHDFHLVSRGQCGDHETAYTLHGSMPSVINSLVPYALGFESPDAPHSDLSRHHAYAHFIEEWGMILFPANFYLEAKLLYVMDGTLISPDVRTVHSVICQMHGSNVNSNLLPHGQYHSELYMLRLVNPCCDP